MKTALVTCEKCEEYPAVLEGSMEIMGGATGEVLTWFGNCKVCNWSEEDCRPEEDE